MSRMVLPVGNGVVRKKLVKSNGTKTLSSDSVLETGIVDPRPLCLREERSTPPVTPAPPSTPRKVQPSAMTVSVTHAQVSVTTTTPNSAMMALAMGRPPSPGNSSGSDTDGIANPSARTALRRLYFKSGRNAKIKTVTNNPSTVPKVVVMGSSTASTSEATINTSTDSASTLVTNVTATDTSETYDSLDMGDTSGQSEPLLSSLDEPPQTAVSLTSDQSGSEVEGTILGSSGQERTSSSQEKLSESSSKSCSSNIPRTAPVTTSVHFPFDLPPSPKSVKTTEKNQSLFTFSETAEYLEQQRQRSKSLHQPFLHNENVETSLSYYEEDDKENKKRKDAHAKLCSGRDHSRSPKDSPCTNNEFEDTIKTKKDTKLKTKTCRHLIKTSPKKEKYSSSSNKINSAPAITSKDKYYSKISSSGYDKKDLTMFPFDREAIDYDRIQRECFAVEEDPKFPYDAESDSETDSDEDPSVYERKPYASPSKSSKIDVFQQYTLLSQQETYHSYERRPPKRNRPDLFHPKYDAFSPKPFDQNSSSKITNELHKFEQIASKFDQMRPKPAQDNHHHFQGTNANLSNQNTGTTITNAPGLSVNTHLSSSSSASNGGTNAGTTTGPRSTPPLPDLRVDFFAESAGMHHQQKHQQHHQHQHDLLDDCQKLSQNAAGAINVTANPMETAVCTQPRATIVVQQASLSLDNTVETFLLKNEGDFVSVEQAKESRKKKQQREENMRQLLDVTNTLTFEEIRDFEMRYGSPHHSRSQSVKTPGSRASGRPNQLSLPQQRSRVASMPNTGVEEEYYRLRHFSITGKGVVNRGDSLKSRRSRSNNSVASSNSSTEHLTANPIPAVGSARTSATCSLASSRESSTSNPGNGPYRVLMLGSSAVGKSSLVSQFMTSEYLHAYDTSIDDESGEKSVSVLLSGEESELVFIDHAYTEMSPENCLSSYDPHGYCVIYSSADRGSFMVAERILQSLWTTENIAQKAVILVGNKADLARSRVVTSDEGKSMATAYDCKFIETSVGINHNVDELLVGLLSQIRLKLENPEKSRDLFRKRSSRKSKRRACSPLGGAATACLTGSGGTNPSTPVGQCQNNLITDFNTPPGSAHSSPRKYRGSRTSASLKVKGLLGRVWARDSKSKSCENLHVL